MHLFATKPKPKNLLDLPPELRELIFALALTSPEPTVTFHLDTFQREVYTEAQHPPLLLTSKQTRHEALPLFYASNAIVLHTEPPKSTDAACWLAHNSVHLGKLCELEFWVRYVVPSDDRGVSSGALGVSVVHDARLGKWVVKDEWRWVTVNRRAADVEKDGALLVNLLRELFRGRSRDELAAEDYVGIVEGLRTLYLKAKLGHLI